MSKLKYQGQEFPEHYFEKHEGVKQATTIIRRRQPTLQEQIQYMVRAAQAHGDQVDEDFADDVDHGDEDFYSPHELVRDHELGVEMTRIERDLYEREKPKFQKHATNEALRQFHEKKSRANAPRKASFSDEEQSDSRRKSRRPKDDEGAE